jgi:nucleoside diphosphate kinase
MKEYKRYPSKREFIFVMIKPWSLKFTKEILSELDSFGRRIKTFKVEKIPLEIIAQQYSAHKEKPYYHPMIHDHKDKPSVIAIYSGVLDDFKAMKQKIREKYRPYIEQAGHYNRDAIHMTIDKKEFENDLYAWMGHFRDNHKSGEDILIDLIGK